MPTPPAPTVREVLLSLVHEMDARRQGGNLQQSTLLNAAKDRLVPVYGNPDLEQAVLTQWHELFRTGLLAWGFNLSNPSPPFFHLTDTGRRALANATRDPSNPAGYLKHLEARASIGPVAKSYLVEGLDCYVAGLYKAAAVMVGAAAEAVVLDLRDVVIAQLTTAGIPVSKDLKDWKIRTVTMALAQLFDERIDRKSDRVLREEYEMYWGGFTGQMRTVRNEAGHPTSIDPVTADTVHASLLIFPELCGLTTSLTNWVSAKL
jgi:hypothetical protein